MKPETGTLRISHRYSDGYGIEEYDGTEWFLNIEKTDAMHKAELARAVDEIEREKTEECI